ncbi:hypothetical protein A3C09_03160 [Candidatus Uhrbacteria bacterium RIFCSPHIGHO2_02_FULL_47_44]|uniref:Uncharacterized protein n=1 Tax=Candidatus Uhrbacteria bacterium RIFCSPLOWO2_02_FULL_48_18 TaxID=1802408 RepID=A0A1F7V9F3_9BACT|nr:MAG: hypothetical protein A3C09_03160 [Candidatus Uhrbacteria bacterium RIFCSPHIGHO2_02_FULL_47_44]OGL76974.1 MAG: hypothetical protein A3E97_05215 [Candidatus Uhrbacteria bacterium RIFCSPHIGHO2_12_FULL_47_12]OGL86584.1 MAG: hypothetical protein A3I41_04840 [Candidatus Uhrbacteria bacterium RIFCSPLOWO2_02_FULL_48_18]OGL92579.1 MAG: hypothetical protein A3H12_02385 [Candidatus Uhrbacteria bacterium RIFCSPLOWO2_12_FULL_47_9]
MMRRKLHKGITLIETLLYIALLVLILPPLVLSLVRVTRQVSLLDVRNRINTSSSLILSQVTRDITQATQIKTSLSTLGTTPGTLIFLDATGQTITIDRQDQVIVLPGGNQTVHRLRMTRGASPAFYLTDPDLDVQSWQVDVVRNSASVLTGLRFHLDVATMNPSTLDPYQNARLVADTTVDLQPHTTEN